MSNIAVLNKVLGVREIEKQDAEKAHQHATEQFEQVATKLYHLLKKKETAEKQYEETTKAGAEIEKIQSLLTYIDNLNNEIIQIQQKVNKARIKMENKQDLLTDAYVEVKKFEKVIETREKERDDWEEKQEQLFMDEVSIRQYFNQN